MTAKSVAPKRLLERESEILELENKTVRLGPWHQSMSGHVKPQLLVADRI
ncbi:MAG: hypothetical protein WAN65_25900 [Candidatus Sulfotelmatobacter sp.]